MMVDVSACCNKIKLLKKMVFGAQYQFQRYHTTENIPPKMRSRKTSIHTLFTHLWNEVKKVVAQHNLTNFDILYEKVK